MWDITTAEFMAFMKVRRMQSMPMSKYLINFCAASLDPLAGK